MNLLIEILREVQVNSSAITTLNQDVHTLGGATDAAITTLKQEAHANNSAITTLNQGGFFFIFYFFF